MREDGMIKLGIIGTGGMAGAHASNFSKIEGVRLEACCDLDPDRAAVFAQRHGIERVCASVEELLDGHTCDAVAVVTTDPSHAPISIAALQAEKHVLCEKPLATSYKDALCMVEAARKAGTVNMVNFSYRSSSALNRAIEWCAEGRLGRIFHVEAQYLQGWLCDNYWGDFRLTPHLLWRLSTSHGSKGVLGDIGVHILDFATAPAGPLSSIRCRLHNFSEKVPGNQIGDYLLDANDSAFMTFEFANGAMGQALITRVATGHQNSLLLKIHGSRGALSIDLDAGYNRIECCTIKASGRSSLWECYDTGEAPTVYERFIAAIGSGQPDPLDFARGAEIQKWLDACFVSNQTDRTVDLETFDETGSSS